MSIRLRHRCALLLLAVTLLIAPLQASAQSAPAAEPVPTARERLTAGDRLQRLHLFEAALVEYEQAYALAPSASTLKRIADAQRDLPDAAAATTSYEKLLTLRDLTRDDKRAAERALKTLESESGSLTISGVEGAVVTMDGRAVGPLPIAKPVRAASGAHVIRVTKEGFEPFSTQVEVKPGAAASVEARLVPESQTGSVLVREKGQRTVRIAIDGRPAGNTPYFGELPAGEHTFELAEANASSLRLTVKIIPKLRAEVVLEAMDTVGILKIDAQPAEAEVLIDGKPLAPGTREIQLPFGRHEVSARAAGYNVISEAVDVSSAKGATWSVRLQKVVAAPVAKEQDYSGGHFDIALAGTLPLHSHVGVCPAEAGTGRTCDDGSRLGGGLLLRGGYDFGVIGIDVTALAFVNHGEDTVEYPGGAASSGAPEAAFAHTQKYELLDVGAILAVGPTLTSRGETFRVTGGIAGGVGGRLAAFRRSLRGQINDELLDTSFSFAPAGIGHVSLLIGSTPGAKLEIGLMLAIEKQSYTTNATTRQVDGTTGSAAINVPAYEVFKDVQVYFGPTIGGRFGY